MSGKKKDIRQSDVFTKAEAALAKVQRGLEKLTKRSVARIEVQNRVNTIAVLGIYDEPTTKDWVIQEMWRLVMGWTHGELARKLKKMGWKKGTSP